MGTKIWTAQMTATTSSWKEDRYRITVDKNINWDGSTLASPDGSSTKTTGYVQIVKFTPTTTATRRARSLCKAQARGLKSRAQPVLSHVRTCARALPFPPFPGFFSLSGRVVAHAHAQHPVR